MEYSFVILTESNSEITYQWEDENDVRVLRMPYTIGGTEIFYDLGREIDIISFYSQMRKGATVTTAQRNPNEIVEYFEPYLKAGKDILHIAFSSALSGTFGCENMAAEELREKYPERKIILVDSLTISAPLSLLVNSATKMRAEGKTMEEIAEWVEANKQRACALFTVDNLEYLRRGGRLSGTAAFFGNVLELKPVLHVSSEGKLVPFEKIKGRKKALRFLAEQCAKTIENPSEQVIEIRHADCLDEAKQLEVILRELVNPKDVFLHLVGPVLGSHCGPGTIALCYYGKDRGVTNA